MIATAQRGLVAFLVTDIGGVLHALVKARAEPGNADTIMLGPTIQTLLGVDGSSGDGQQADIYDLVANAAVENVRYSCVQSEEGGRFYHVESDYRIVEVAGGERIALPPEYMWLSFRQLQDMVRFGLLGVEARSLLSCLSVS